MTELDAVLKRLNLANTRRVWPSLVEQAEVEGWSCRRFLEVLVQEEVAHRQQTRLVRCARDAKFPFLKTIDDFDFSLQSQLRLALLGSYLSPDFVTDGRSLILYGRSGRGKTHLAVAIAYRAIQNGFDALFTSAAALISDVSLGMRFGRFQEVLHRYTRVHVLVVDEVGYLSYGDNAADVLYHVVAERHLAGRPMIFTTNKTLTDWGDVLHDHHLAETIIDRVLERGRFITVDGPSYRTRHIDPSILPSPAIISGKDRPDLLEPTPSEPGSFLCERNCAHRRACGQPRPTPRFKLGTGAAGLCSRGDLPVGCATHGHARLARARTARGVDCARFSPTIRLAEVGLSVCKRPRASDSALE